MYVSVAIDDQVYSLGEEQVPRLSRGVVTVEGAVAFAGGCKVRRETWLVVEDNHPFTIGFGLVDDSLEPSPTPIEVRIVTCRQRTVTVARGGGSVADFFPAGYHDKPSNRSIDRKVPVSLPPIAPGIKRRVRTPSR